MSADETKTFIPLNIAVLTISDTRALDTDTSGQLLAERLRCMVCPSLSIARYSYLHEFPTLM